MTECNVAPEETVDQPSKEIVDFDPICAETVTAQMARAVARATNRSVTDLPPLGEWVDCDAIEQLFTAHDHGNELSVSFQFEDCQVFVSNIGRIVVTPDSDFDRY